MSRRNKYSPLGDAATRLSDAYKTNAGQIVGGALNGGLGATIAGMSAVADEGMLGVHVVLGLIWLTMVTKDYAQAFSNHLAKTPEILGDIGVEIFLYSKLMEEKMLRERGEVNQQEFTSTVNKNLFNAINADLEKAGYPKIGEIADIEEGVHALSSKEQFLLFLKEKTEISNEKLLTGIAAVGAAATVGGAVAIAASGKAAGAIATTAVGAAATSVAGGILLAKTGSAKEIAQRLYQSIRGLNNSKDFPGVDIDEKREEIAKDNGIRSQINTVVRPIGGSGNKVSPLVRGNSSDQNFSSV